MERNASRGHAMGGLMVFALLCAFALMCLVTVLLSVQGYRGIEADLDANAQRRVAAGYLRAKVRAADRAGDVTLRQEDGAGTVLCLREGELESRIYAAGGALREQLALAGDPFDPELGETIAQAEGLQGALEGRQLTLTLALPQGEALTLAMTLRSEEVSP